MTNNQQAFFVLVKAGLWEQEARLSEFNDIDYTAIMRMAEGQSLVGVITAGLEHVQDVKVPKAEVLQYIGVTMQLEQRNKEMNKFISLLTKRLQEKGIYALLVKGQGIAQCYERPLWRACGDVDLLLDDENYQKAKEYLLRYGIPEEEDKERKHLGIAIEGWLVELHGTLRSALGRRVDNEIDKIQKDTFKKGCARAWRNEDTDILLPAPDNDVIFVFTHILQHFFGGGIGLRQICDWCRLLWTYRESLDHGLLESRVRRMGLMSQWKALAALAVNTLGMPVEAMPLYSTDKKWVRKANRVLLLILESGNFGHGRDMSHKQNYPKVIEYLISFWIYTKYSIRQFIIFPKEAFTGWIRTISLGVKAKTK